MRSLLTLPSAVALISEPRLPEHNTTHCNTMRDNTMRVTSFMPQQNTGSTTVSPPQILHIAVPVPLTQTFSYLPPQDTPLAACQTGSRIGVHFRQKRLVGFIVGHGHADPN
ncbi:MAG: hypothetical protein P8104_07985, partial [Gammaproteobacteria bacterium]